MKKFIFSQKALVAISLLMILFHFIFIKMTQWQLPNSLVQKKVLIQGVIDSVPQRKFHGLAFHFHVFTINHQKINTHFLISWYQYPPRLNVGEHWKLTVKLKPVIGFHNPNGFDYAEFLLSHGIMATGFVVTRDGHNKLIGKNNAYFLDHFRQDTQQQINAAVHNHAVAAFVSALSVGLRDGLSQSDWQVFQKTGTNHLVAIAGLHIGFVFGTIYFFSKRISKLFPKLFLYIPASRFAELIALLGALGYAALSGLAIPAQRASLILCFLMATSFLYKTVSVWKRLLFSGIIILIMNPYDIIDASFWLSFSSIGILAWVLSGRLRSSNHLISWTKMQVAIVIGLLPLMLFFFQQASIIAVLTNAIAIPWVGFFILPMTLIATLFFSFHLYSMSHFTFWLTGKCLLPLWILLKYAAHLSIASWHHAIANPFALIVAMIGGVFLLAPRGFPARFLGCFGLLPLFFYHPAYPKWGDYRVTVIDVGQGLSVLVQTARHVMLYDADYGESVVAPYLRTEGITRIDHFTISHPDNRRSNNITAIVKDFQVKTGFTGGSNCMQGQSWNWDGVHFDTLDNSCVIKISGKGGSVLLTGNIQKSTESALVAQYGRELQSTVLLVPHYGSRTSSSENFLNTVLPQYAIISAGKYNRYHFPAKSVIFRYFQHKIHLYNTANNGAIIIRFHSASGVRLSSEM